MTYYLRFKKLQKYIYGQPTNEYKQGDLVKVGNWDSLSECEGDYKWIEDGTTCIAYSLYKRLKQVDKEGNPTGKYKTGDLIDQYSSECGWKELRREVFIEETCLGSDLVNKYQIEQSMDLGQTWTKLDQYTYKTIQKNACVTNVKPFIFTIQGDSYTLPFKIIGDYYVEYETGFISKNVNTYTFKDSGNHRINFWGVIDELTNFEGAINQWGENKGFRVIRLNLNELPDDTYKAIRNEEFEIHSDIRKLPIQSTTKLDVSDCKNLTILPKAKYIDASGCTSLIKIDNLDIEIGTFINSGITSLPNQIIADQVYFNECKLTDISNCSLIVNKASFAKCPITDIGVIQARDDVADRSNMFLDCKITEVNINKIDFTERGKQIDYTSMFENNPITKISGLFNVWLSKATSLDKMFKGCKLVELPNIFEDITEMPSCNQMFMNNQIEQLDDKFFNYEIDNVGEQMFANNRLVNWPIQNEKDIWEWPHLTQIKPKAFIGNPDISTMIPIDWGGGNPVIINSDNDITIYGKGVVVNDQQYELTSSLNVGKGITYIYPTDTWYITGNHKIMNFGDMQLPHYLPTAFKYIQYLGTDEGIWKNQVDVPLLMLSGVSEVNSDFLKSANVIETLLGMFQGNKSLKSFLTGWIQKHPTIKSIEGLFSNSVIENADHLFEGSQIEEASNCLTGNLKSAKYTFTNCKKLTCNGEVFFKVSDDGCDFTGCFANCTSLVKPPKAIWKNKEVDLWGITGATGTQCFAGTNLDVPTGWK